MDKFSFKTIETSIESKVTEKNSRFYGFAYPITSEEACKDILNQLRSDHPKANHHCYAWRLGLTKNEYRANDDGEPSGSAGRPILGQIDSFELTNVLVVVVRYFGGVKLGVSGLIKAYKQSAMQTLKSSTIIEQQVKKRRAINVKYDNITTFRSWVSKNNIRIINEEYTDEFGSFELDYLLKDQQRVVEQLKQFTE